MPDLSEENLEANSNALDPSLNQFRLAFQDVDQESTSAASPLQETTAVTGRRDATSITVYHELW